MPPPTSGGIAIAQILTMLEPFDLSRIPPNSAQAVHLVAEASKLAFADRDQYVSDPDFVKVPVAGLLDRHYLKSRAAMISADKAMGKATPGIPPQLVQRNHAPDDGDNRPIFNKPYQCRRCKRQRCFNDDDSWHRLWVTYHGARLYAQ